ncbi:hypothetical protein Nmel_018157 [Mimus melanotis]
MSVPKKGNGEGESRRGGSGGT